MPWVIAHGGHVDYIKPNWWFILFDFTEGAKDLNHQILQMLRKI
jgi:hypothetical protein